MYQLSSVNSNYCLYKCYVTQSCISNSTKYQCIHVDNVQLDTYLELLLLIYSNPSHYPFFSIQPSFENDENNKETNTKICFKIIINSLSLVQLQWCNVVKPIGGCHNLQKQTINQEPMWQLSYFQPHHLVQGLCTQQINKFLLYLLFSTLSFLGDRPRVRIP